MLKKIIYNNEILENCKFISKIKHMYRLEYTIRKIELCKKIRRKKNCFKFHPTCLNFYLYSI